MKTITKLLLTILIFTSCSVQNNLLKVDKHYYKVVFSTPDKLILINSKLDTVEYDNLYNEPILADDFIIFE